MPLDVILLPRLAEALGRAFDNDALNTVVMLSLGENMYVNYVPDSLTRAETARRLLTRLSEENKQEPFLAAALAARPGEPELRDLVAAACPDALLVRRSADEQVRSVLTGLEVLRMRLGDPTVKQALAQWSEKLTVIARTLELLAAYKTMHDGLHTLVMQQLWAAEDSVKRFTTDTIAVVALDNVVNAIRMCCENAEEAASVLADTASERGLESAWTDSLRQVAAQLSMAMDTLDRGLATRAVWAFRKVLRQEPARLDGLLVRNVDALPLDALSAALQQIKDVANDADPASAARLGAGLEGLRQLAPMLRGRVGEHRRWQDVDTQLWAVDEQFGLGPAEIWDSLDLFWPEARSRAAQLSALAPAESWASDLHTNAGRVDAAMAKHDLVAARSVFHRYRSAAQMQFFRVDRKLKQECSATVRIGEPLRALLQEAGHG